MRKFTVITLYINYWEEEYKHNPTTQDYEAESEDQALSMAWKDTIKAYTKGTLPTGLPYSMIVDSNEEQQL
jgi:hypothetical protein